MLLIGKRGALAGAMLLISAGEALATENIVCTAPNYDTSFSFLVGTTPGLKPLSLSMEAKGRKWATSAEAGVTPILVAQSFSDEGGMKIDVTDGNAEAIIAKLRVSYAHEEGTDGIFSGTLHIVGVGAWPVTCLGE
ncbi:hypothetical protein G5V57_29225 [Nordella sp. HKS 07]|uniref:hypothetical protein n=1 Tax=Nordella sp. HKS 07 TaxID=2712222 RepID=UPI0013E1B563|nr:hypothetical protein [Nordella sp. HKS 07]QIG51440.1 hypothetical protein G5V57_29225 [Nordella sp. HKS 07]